MYALQKEMYKRNRYDGSFIVKGVLSSRIGNNVSLPFFYSNHYPP